MAGISDDIVVNFCDSGDAILTAEIDSRADGYNGGKTSFNIGDEPVILVRKTNNVTITSIITSLGTCSQFATGSTNEEEFLTYPQTKEADVSKPVDSNFVSLWYGNDLGAVKVVGQKKVSLTSTSPNTQAGVLGVTYASNFIAYKLTGIPSTVNVKTVFEVLILFTGAVI